MDEAQWPSQCWNPAPRKHGLGSIKAERTSCSLIKILCKCDSANGLLLGVCRYVGWLGSFKERCQPNVFPESHARQKEMCFLKVLPADENLSAVIKVVKSSPTPLPAHTWKMRGFASQTKPDLGSTRFPSKELHMDLAVNVLGESTARTWWCWADFHHLLLCCCAPTPTGIPVQGPHLRNRPALGYLLPLPTQVVENQWKRDLVGPVSKNLHLLCRRTFPAPQRAHYRIPCINHITVAFLWDAPEYLSRGCSLLIKVGGFPCAALLPGPSISCRTWSWTLPSSLLHHPQEKFIWEWWGWQRILISLFPRSCVCPAVLSHPEKCSARWEPL